MQPEIDYQKIGLRIKKARALKGLTQADLGALVGCSNNHISHIEVGQTKASLTMLLKLSYALDTSLDSFLLDTPYARAESIIDGGIAKKLEQCSPPTLVAVNEIIDVLLRHQQQLDKE